MSVFCRRAIMYLLVTLVISALLVPTLAYANGTKRPTTKPPVIRTVPPIPSKTVPACFTSVSASSVGNTAYIFTCPDWVSQPEQINGTAQFFVCTVPSAAAASSAPSAEVFAKFTYGGSQYTVKFTCVLPAQQMGFGGIEILKPVFGASGPSVAGIVLPATLAYASVLGNVTITKDGEVISENQPAIAMVTQGIHNVNGQLLSESNPSGREIQLLVPGALATGGSAIPGFASSNFYIYWPDAAVDVRNLGGQVVLTDIQPPVVTIPGGAGAGPLVATPLRISLTDTGIVKDMATAPSGLYDVTIVNNSKTQRGLFMTGVDMCCTEFNRYSRVLQPGKSQSFRFYFAPGKVGFKDMLKCERKERTCAVATFGKHSTSIVFE